MTLVLGDADPTGRERHVAKKLLSDFMQRQAGTYEHKFNICRPWFLNRRGMMLGRNSHWDLKRKAKKKGLVDLNQESTV